MHGYTYMQAIDWDAFEVYASNTTKQDKLIARDKSRYVPHHRPCSFYHRELSAVVQHGFDRHLFAPFGYTSCCGARTANVTPPGPGLTHKTQRRT